MAQYIDNPAGRLHKLLLDLHAAYPNEQQQQSKAAWIALVELIGNDSGLAGEAQIVAAVAALPAQIRDAVAHLSVDEDRKEHLLSNLDEVENGVVALMSRQPLFAMFTTFATKGEVPRSAAISALSHCSYELHLSMSETVISDDDLARIIEMINELIEEVTEAELPSVVKRAMLNHLVALLQAAHNVRIAGTGPLDDAMFALTGSIMRTNAQEDLVRVGLWERFTNVMSTLNLMLSTGQGAVQLGQGIAGMLGG